MKQKQQIEVKIFSLIAIMAKTEEISLCKSQMVIKWTPDWNRIIFLDTDNTRQGETCPNREHMLSVVTHEEEGPGRLWLFFLPAREVTLPPWGNVSDAYNGAPPIRKDLSEIVETMFP